ncbi:TIGR02391 family protein [Marinobacter hydrocarbonoclasticus]|nr:TIGR02391 family protein [Marinobacter nauticus]
MDFDASEIQYMGVAGLSAPSYNALCYALQRDEKLESVYVLSAPQNYHTVHAFLLCFDFSTIIIKSGFASGYGGEGPQTFSRALQLLYKYSIGITEYEVSSSFMAKVDSSRLSDRDISKLRSMQRKIPNRLPEFMIGQHDIKQLLVGCPETLPLSVIDDRLFPIAIRFWENPDAALLDAYRRLEGIVREKAGLPDESSTKLFSKAFVEEQSKLFWKDIDKSEARGRGLLFTSTFMAYRNRRAHREVPSTSAEDLRELLLLNQLYVLESTSTLRPVEAEETVLSHAT